MKNTYKEYIESKQRLKELRELVYTDALSVELIIDLMDADMECEEIEENLIKLTNLN